MNIFAKIAISIATYAFLKPSNESTPSIGKMNTFRFIPVFKEASRGRIAYNLGFTKNKSGVYVIKEDGKIVYIGFSGSNLYKTITRHFQSWNDPRQRRVTYVNKIKRNRYTIRVVFTNPTKAFKLERALIAKYRPRDNFEILELLDLEEKEAAKIQKQNEKVIVEYNNEDKYDYPPDWDL